MNGAVVWSRRRRHSPRVMVGSRRSRWRRGLRKTTKGDSHPDRDAQFGYINSQVTAALAEQQPVISVDTKKKELVGDFRTNGRAPKATRKRSGSMTS